jgi:adenosylhomocysteine nucleosidase
VQPKLLISSGFAGALSPDLRVGSVVFDARDTAHSGLDELVAECVAGKIHTAERAIESPADKAALARETGALAVDMETASIASVCAETGIPVVGIRGVSDAATDPLPVPMPHWFDLERQRPRPVGLVCYLAKNPGSIGPFARFVGGLSCARSAMTGAVIIFMEEIGRSKK